MSRLTVDRTGIRRGHRRLDAARVRRVHFFTDESGTRFLVVRGGTLRTVSFPTAWLADSDLEARVHDLLDAVRGHATIDGDVAARFPLVEFPTLLSA